MEKIKEEIIMSHHNHNYTNYSNKNIANNQEAADAVEEKVVNEEQAIEEKIVNEEQAVEEKIVNEEQAIEEKIVNESQQNISDPESDIDVAANDETSELIGYVTDCVKLNVREAASKDSNALCEIILNSKVIVDEENSTDDFYKVTTETGVEGYCMKQYINVI